MLLLYTVEDFKGILYLEVALPLGGVVTWLTAGGEYLPVVSLCLLESLPGLVVGD